MLFKTQNILGISLRILVVSITSISCVKTVVYNEVVGWTWELEHNGRTENIKFETDSSVRRNTNKIGRFKVVDDEVTFDYHDTVSLSMEGYYKGSYEDDLEGNISIKGIVFIDSSYKQPKSVYKFFAHRK
jgi:hypothetical protein